MPLSSEITLPPDARAPRNARAFIAKELADDLSDDTLAAVQLLVSELVTNSVVHAASPVEVQCVRDDSGVTVRVRDADTGPLVLGGAIGTELGEGGRGLVLVDRFASAWGTEHHGGRKTVWFHVSTLTEGSPAPALPRSPGRVVAIDDESLLATAERRLAALVLPPPLLDALTFREQVAELLARIVEALGAEGAVIRWAKGEDAVVTCGRIGAVTGHDHDLVFADRQLGTLTVHVEDPDDEARAFLRIAAERLSLLGYEDLVSQAGEHRTTELDYLSEASELLSGTLTVRASLTMLPQIVVPQLGDWAGTYVVDDRRRVNRIAANHRREERLDALVALLEHDQEVLDAVQAAADDTLPNRLPAAVSVAGQRSWVVVVPLVSRSRALAVLVVGCSKPVEAKAYMALLELGRRAALTVDNARLHEEQGQAAHALQSALLPPAMPVIDGLDLAARYESASPGLLVGGDFYDAFVLPDGTLVCAIGDVCGKGAEAATVTGISRDLLRVLLRDGHSLASALHRLNRALAEDISSNRFCTVALLALAREGEVMRGSVCLAGHPEPVLLRADGSTELVGSPGDLLGVFADDVAVNEVPVVLHPGDTLVLYTDGITERRGEGRMFGQYGLRTTLERASGADASALARKVEVAVRSFVDSEIRDDIALLLVRALP